MPTTNESQPAFRLLLTCDRPAFAAGHDTTLRVLARIQAPEAPVKLFQVPELPGEPCPALEPPERLYWELEPWAPPWLARQPSASSLWEPELRELPS